MGCDAGRSSGLVDAVFRLRLRTSGLCLARLAVVGDANEGLCGGLEGEERGSGCGSEGSSRWGCDGGGPGGVVDSTGTDSVGEVLRRLGAEGSMMGGNWRFQIMAGIVSYIGGGRLYATRRIARRHLDAK